MAERLIYLPLGGAGEIGMNAYVYGYGEPGRERLIVVDLGVTFGDIVFRNTFGDIEHILTTSICCSSTCFSIWRMFSGPNCSVFWAI